MTDDSTRDDIYDIRMTIQWHYDLTKDNWREVVCLGGNASAQVAAEGKLKES
jgi:hypothetical protein